MNPENNAPQPIPFNVTKFEMLKEAYNKGELKIGKVERFRNQWPKHRHVFYMCDLRVNGEIIMYNAYEMPVEVEEYLLKTGGQEQLLAYIVFNMTFRL
ncbi:MAG: hypothetical protein ACXVIY_00930 [Mucilaginibacter sp.]